MPSGRSARRDHDPHHQAQLQKRSIRAGSILWLRKNVNINENNLMLLSAARLQKGSLNHPVLVLDMLEGRPSHVQICKVTSCGGNSITASNIDPSLWSFYLPIQPTPCHSRFSEGPLGLEGNAQMRKLSYVDMRDSHQISLVLLEKYDRNKVVSSHRLTPESLDRVRFRCGFQSLRSHSLNNCHAVIDAAPYVPQAFPRCSSRRQIHSLSREIPTRQAVEDNPPSYRELDPEQAPLLSPPSDTTMPYASYVQVRPPRRPHCLAHRNLGTNGYGIGYHPPHGASNMSAYLTTIRTVFVCILLCMAVMCLGILGYGVFLGIAWLVRAFVSLLTIIKTDIVAVGQYIAHLGRVIAGPVVAVGEAIASSMRTVTHLFREILRWIKELKNLV